MPQPYEAKEVGFARLAHFLLSPIQILDARSPKLRLDAAAGARRDNPVQQALFLSAGDLASQALDGVLHEFLWESYDPVGPVHFGSARFQGIVEIGTFDLHACLSEQTKRRASAYDEALRR